MVDFKGWTVWTWGRRGSPRVHRPACPAVPAARAPGMPRPPVPVDKTRPCAGANPRRRFPVDKPAHSAGAFLGLRGGNRDGRPVYLHVCSDGNGRLSATCPHNGRVCPRGADVGGSRPHYAPICPCACLRRPVGHARSPTPSTYCPSMALIRSISLSTRELNALVSISAV